MNRVLNFGSINIDYVYRVPHFVRPGETLASRSLQVFGGGKGANQSVALGRAGASVHHAGCIGEDGRWLLDLLQSAGVDVSLIRIDPDHLTGNAIIQVDDDGENAILLHGGANQRIGPAQIDETLSQFGEGDVLLLQHEINDTPRLIRHARRRGMTIAFNPAPMTDAVEGYPLDEVDLLIVNETEGQALTGETANDAILQRLPGREKLLTLGAAGVVYLGPEGDREEVPALRVEAVDTTAAGDTFIGFFLAARAEGLPIRPSLELACRAAAICVTRPGAMDAIPTRAEVDDQAAKGT